MNKFFKRLLGKPTCVWPNPDSIDKLPFNEARGLVDHMLKTNEFPQIATFKALHRRLHWFAWFDHFDLDIRSESLRYLKVTSELITAGLDETGKIAWRDLEEKLAQVVLQRGFGSLAWEIEEKNIKDLHHFLLEPTNGPRLKNYLDCAYPNGIPNEVKTVLVRELLRTRAYGKNDNAVLALHGLATRKDPATVAIFSKNELRRFFYVPRDYQSARMVLVQLGLLDSQSSAVPFAEFSDKAIAAVSSQRQATWNWWQKDDLFERIPREVHDLARFSLLAVCENIRQEMLRQIWGAQGEAAIETFSARLPEPVQQLIQVAHLNMEASEDKIYNMDLHTVYMTLDRFGKAPQNEEELERGQIWMSEWAQIINRERVESLGHIRYMLRAVEYIIRGEEVPKDEVLRLILEDTILPNN